jgi:hypothetical protein
MFEEDSAVRMDDMVLLAVTEKDLAILSVELF